jgi:hypothetical protein
MFPEQPPQLFPILGGGSSCGEGGSQRNRPAGLWAHLTAAGTGGYAGFYSWEEVTKASDAGTWEIVTGGRTGDYAQPSAAEEANLFDTVPVGTFPAGAIVRLWPAGVVDGTYPGELVETWLFCYEPSGAPRVRAITRSTIRYRTPAECLTTRFTSTAASSRCIEAAAGMTCSLSWPTAGR